jgi:hypothetical protein
MLPGSLPVAERIQVVMRCTAVLARASPETRKSVPRRHGSRQGVVVVGAVIRSLEEAGRDGYRRAEGIGDEVGQQSRCRTVRRLQAVDDRVGVVEECWSTPGFADAAANARR